MTCRECIDFLLDYLSEQLPAEQRVTLEAHLRECPECVAYLKSYESTVKLGKGAFKGPGDPVPNEMPEKLVQAILAARRKST